MRSILFPAAVAAWLAGSVAMATPLATSITYQGELTEAGVPVDGNADFQFTLYDAVLGGAAIGSMVQIDDVAIGNGRFTAEIDFGDSFDGGARFLEIRARNPHDPTDTQPFVLLDPRQPLTAAPYALHAGNGGWIESGIGIMNENPGFVGINRDSQITSAEIFGVHSPVTTSYGGMYITTEGATAKPFYGYKAGAAWAWSYLDGGDADWHLNVGSTDRLTVTDEGNVGVGSTNPTEKLQVAGTVHSTTGGFKFPDGTTQTTAATSQGGNTLDQSYDEGGAGLGRTITADAGAVTITGTGGLDVSVSSSNTALVVNSSGTAAIARFRDAGVDAVVIDNQGDLGIGYSNPATKLDVRDPVGTTNVMNLERTVASVASSDLLQIEAHTDGSDLAQFIECERGIDVEFRVWGDGDVTADGTYSGPADFAEMVKVTSGFSIAEAGDVMVIDPDAERGFLRSSTVRSTLVAGVFSTNPGFVGSEHDWDGLAREMGLIPRAAEGEEEIAMKPMEIARRIEEIPLAVVGIVPCKVTAENGPIRAGDLLVTSSRPGHAMRDENPRAGTIVGKALGSLPSGTGVVRVLVTLQ